MFPTDSCRSFCRLTGKVLSSGTCVKQSSNVLVSVPIISVATSARELHISVISLKIEGGLTISRSALDSANCCLTLKMGCGQLVPFSIGLLMSRTSSGKLATLMMLLSMSPRFCISEGGFVPSMFPRLLYRLSKLKRPRSFVAFRQIIRFESCKLG